MFAEQRSLPEGLREGTAVEVVTHFTGSWTRGFEVAALHADGCEVRRLSDGAVLPLEFEYTDVRAADGDRDEWAVDIEARPARPDVDELITRLARAKAACDIARIAGQLGETGEHCAVRPLLQRLPDDQVQTLPEVEEAVCGALIALDVMRVSGERSFALRPRHLLSAEVVDMISELDPSVPMRYLIARQA